MTYKRSRACLKRRAALKSKRNLEFIKRMVRKHRGFYMSPMNGILFARAHRGRHEFHRP